MLNLGSQSPPITIEKVAYGGKGIARYEGKVFFVNDTVPGDVVTTQTLKDHGAYIEAKPIKFIKLSHLRTMPQCQHSFECGGCQWQDIAVDYQLGWKKDFLSSALVRIGKISEFGDIQVIRSPKVGGYRNRVTLRARISPNGRLRVGFFQKGSRNFIPINLCHVASPVINKFIKLANNIEFSAGIAQKLRIEVQELPEHENFSILIRPEFPNSPGLEEIQRRLAEATGALQVACSLPHFQISKSEPVVTETDRGLKFFFLPGGFQQANSELNRELRSLVQKIAELHNPETILDLYAGNGNLSFQLAAVDRKIDAVENCIQQGFCASKGIRENSLPNYTFYRQDTFKFLGEVIKRRNKTFYDLVIVDPPRQGMALCMSHILKIQPKSIIYVSCNPTTLARDLQQLKARYDIKSLKILDFFPNTYHLETFCFLQRKP